MKRRPAKNIENTSDEALKKLAEESDKEEVRKAAEDEAAKRAEAARTRDS